VEGGMLLHLLGYIFVVASRNFSEWNEEHQKNESGLLILDPIFKLPVHKVKTLKI
jgi:hypothetical protein